MLTAWANTVTRRPVTVILACALIAAASIWVTLTSLQFKSDRSELVDASLPWQHRYARYRAQFPRWDDAVVVIDRGQTPESRAQADAFIDELERLVIDDPRLPYVTAGVDRADAPPGLILTEPADRVKAIVDDLLRAGPVLSAPSLDVLLGLSELGGDALSAEQRQGLTGLLGRVAEAAEHNRSAGSVLGMESADGKARFVSRTGRLATMLVSLQEVQSEGTLDDETGVNTKSRAIAALRGHIKTLRARPEFAGVEAGVTGVSVQESDETGQSLRDAGRASALSLVLITILMLLAYRGWMVPVFAVASLLVGMAWSFGWATLTVGHLQLLSVTFASLLLGLGIDVAIHLIARLELVHPDHDHLAPAIAQAFRGVGPGILTSSATVAAAAGAMALTRFAGVAEMGLIAAGGILLCTISIMCMFPALLMLMPKPEQRLRTHEGGESRPFMGRLGVAFHRHPRLVLLASIATLGGAAWLATGVRYDTDLQKLLPTGTESVVWQHRLEDDDAKSVWHAVIPARNEEEARVLTERLRALDVVDDVGGAGMLFLPESELAAKRAELSRLPDVSSLPAASAGDGSNRAVAIADRVKRIATGLAARWGQRDEALACAAGRIAALQPQALTAPVLAYEADRAGLLERLAALRSAKPVGPDSLPRALRSLMVGKDGSLLLRVYPTEDASRESVLSRKRLDAFASAVLAAAPMATGSVIQIYESTRLITNAYVEAGLWALAAIVVLLLLDFGLTRRGILDTLCALLPVFGGAILMLAIMRLNGVELNFANMIVMPLLVGIGVGCGVHAVRRWRLQPSDEPLGLAGGSGRAITLTTLTTVIGFAAMMSAQHRGIRSLGFVMSIGLVMVWAVTILVLPSVFQFRRGTRAPESPVEGSGSTRQWQGGHEASLRQSRLRPGSSAAADRPLGVG